VAAQRRLQSPLKRLSEQAKKRYFGRDVAGEPRSGSPGAHSMLGDNATLVGLPAPAQRNSREKTAFRKKKLSAFSRADPEPWLYPSNEAETEKSPALRKLRDGLDRAGGVPYVSPAWWWWFFFSPLGLFTPSFAFSAHVCCLGVAAGYAR
jgi:hypothetical protein